MIDPMKKHERFVLEELLPMVFVHAKAVNCSPEESAMACFLSVATVLQARGLTDDDLIAAIKSSSILIADTPEVLQ